MWPLMSRFLYSCILHKLFVGRKVQQKYAVWHGHQTTTRWQCALMIELCCCMMNKENEETNLLRSRPTRRFLSDEGLLLCLNLIVIFVLIAFVSLVGWCCELSIWKNIQPVKKFLLQQSPKISWGRCVEDHPALPTEITQPVAQKCLTCMCACMSVHVCMHAHTHTHTHTHTHCFNIHFARWTWVNQLLPWFSFSTYSQTGSVVEWLGGQSSDQQVAGSNLGCCAAESNLRKVVYICMPLSSSSIIWYQPMGGDARWLQR